MANSLWLREGLPFRRTFLETVQAYWARSQRWISLPDAAETINAWWPRRHERIRNCAPRSTPTPFCSVNAVYFRGLADAL